MGGIIPCDIHAQAGGLHTGELMLAQHLHGQIYRLLLGGNQPPSFGRSSFRRDALVGLRDLLILSILRLSTVPHQPH